MKELLTISQLQISLQEGPRQRDLLQDIHVDIGQEETVALVGGSGGGKTSLGLAILRLLPSAMKVTKGEILFLGQDLLTLDRAQMQNIRGKEISMIFQEPLSAFNPVFRIGDQIAEVLEAHTDGPRSKTQDKMCALLDMVEIPEPRRIAGSYPHQLSAGLRQRAMIAQALAASPKLIIADEPIASLDVSIQAQILNLFEELKEKFNLTYLFISHDLRVIEYISDRVIVMYLGKIMEIAQSRDLYKHPIHPYTEALLSAIPVICTQTKKKRIILKGEIPGLTKLPSGCVFNTRCIYARQKCIDEVPGLTKRDGRSFACHYPL